MEDLETSETGIPEIRRGIARRTGEILFGHKDLDDECVRELVQLLEQGNADCTSRLVEILKCGVRSADGL